mmetsp:Transcript_39095/g.91992  ORF Transcript_39095/g.91992 Transcript_39095/m.91992 type:complete len:255 (-) Transcript_39095:1660-2424(-)
MPATSPGVAASCSCCLVYSASFFLKSFSAVWRCFLLSSSPAAVCVGTPASSNLEYLSAMALNISAGVWVDDFHLSRSLTFIASLFSTFFLAASDATWICSARSRSSTSASSSFHRKDPSVRSSRRTPSAGSTSSRTLSHSFRYITAPSLASAAAETESTHWRIAPSTCGSADTFPATFASRSASVPARHSAALAVNHSGVSLPRAPLRTSSRKAHRASSVAPSTSSSSPPPWEVTKGKAEQSSSMPSVLKIFPM